MSAKSSSMSSPLLPNGDNCSSSTSSSHTPYGLPSRSKRNKKTTWGARERAGMSFLIVIAFFAVFGLIILTEVFMIDDKAHGGGVILRHGNLGSRLGDSMPDYDNNNEKDDYDLLDGSVLNSESKFGIFHSNKLRVPGSPYALNDLGIGGGGPNGPSVPWGHVLSAKIEETLPHYPGIKPADGSWQVVNGTRFKFFVYSAYYDRRDGHLVRVIGATKTRSPERVWCRLWYKQKDTSSNRPKYYSATVMARVKIIRENWNLKYSACFVLCPLRDVNLAVPHAVSVVSRLRAPPGNVLLLRNTDDDVDFHNRTTATIREQIPEKMAICVKPFHFNYDQALYLMEYIELNALLGISHFTFYNHTLGPHAACVLNHYIEGNVPGNLTTTDVELAAGTTPSGGERDKGQKVTYVKPTINVLPWDLKMRSQKEIRTEGLFAALNDCLYRNMYRYKYIALVDLDELIIPRHNDTLTDLLSWLNQRYRNRNAGAYSFQNSFFYLQFADDPTLYQNKTSNPALRASLISQRKTRRRSKLHPQKQRSKYICKPETVVEAGNHFVWEFVPGKGSLNVPSDAGILHHYRVCEFGGDDCIKAPSTTDRTATKYVNRLVERVDAVYQYLKKPCGLDELPPAPTKPPATPPSRRLVKVIKDDKDPTETELTASTEPSNKRKKKKQIVFMESDANGPGQARIRFT